MIFAKQILCAVVAESEDEFENMHQLLHEQRYAECVHVAPTLTSFAVNAEIEYVTASTAIIELKQVCFFNEIVGLVGKCHKCGKIYYHIPSTLQLAIRKKEEAINAYSNRRSL